MAQNLLATPPAATSSANHNNNASATKQSPNQQRLAVLRLKRQELEKRLQEKNSLLQELCRKEAHLIGVYPTVTVAGQEGSHNHHHPSSSADDISGNGGKGQYGHNTHSLPRKIGTGFTLSEKYLNKRTLSSPLDAPSGKQVDAAEEEELNNLLLQRDIQQQICKASLKLLNDSALTKSVRRKHKQSYEVAQQKLLEIGQGLSAIQQQQQQNHKSNKNAEGQQVHGNNNNSQTLPLTVKTNFKVPQYPGESPVAQHSRRQRHDSYSNAHHSPVSSTGYALAGSGDHPSGQHPIKGLYRSTSNSSSLNNANMLGKSSLSLDNAHHQQHGQSHGQPQSSSAGHQPHQLHSKPMSYESKSLHNFVMSSPNHSSSYHSSPHPHPALLSPTFYHLTSSFAMTTSSSSGGGASNGSGRATHHQNHYPGNAASLRQSHQQQQQQQFLSPTSQQALIPQSGLGGYWTLNENNERVWCSSTSYSPDPNAGPVASQRHATTLDRKAAIYLPSTSASHGKMKMPSPETSPNQHKPSHQHQQGFAGDGSGYTNHSVPVKSSFSMPHKSTSMGNIEYVASGGRGEDTASLGSFNSDTNNNPAVYHNLVASMAATKVGHYPLDSNKHHQLDNEDDDANNNAPPPLRPKSSASQHGAEKSWYETSLDKVGGGSKAKKHHHKPPALLPRTNNNEPNPQLHIDIPTASSSQQQQQQHLERSMSHRVGGSNNFTTPSSGAVSPLAPPLPPITRHQQQQQQQQSQYSVAQEQETLLHSPGGTSGGMPMSPHKKLTSSASYQGNVTVRRTQSNALGQQSVSSAAALLSPRLSVNGTTPGGVSVDGEEIQVESPKNMTVVQQGKFQPYKEESKPFEMSDFYKYSTKFRQHGGGAGTNTSSRPPTRSGGGGGGGAAEEGSYRGNALYQQEQQQQQQRGVYSDLADVANNNRGSSNNHNNSNGHILHTAHPKNGHSSNNVAMYDRTASNATGAATGGQQQYPISYQ